ncbi:MULTISPECIES: carboxylate--amine ligase [Anaerococcus]|uniref:Carboxylate--amine ligase n=2 Tax=Anaerococcus TaxID=165779 RepID=A0A3E2TI64_9FIRM|nr:MULTISPECIES: carboxylate--amine ligase [Anaerococcus]MDU1864152.1 carboxylate--amine ligase [Anaerococcus sp.]MDU2353283.1 carboxylate--amine ligase [Anaerococcus sp.]MDU2565389.1 carboxylate--amine ligase [Anaerococcus sp.]MDU3211108.1 carboxylate--amine ligase [Anaerococcus sp.]RGB76368.1 carboxylate--amine ligase [Anaerococcus nagyae]
MEEFLPIVLGSDLNTYSIAREIYEAYEIKPVVATSMILLPCIDSQIINIYKKENFSKDSEVFKEVLDRIYEENKDTYKNFIIFAPDDVMRTYALKNIDKLDFNPIMPYASIEVIKDLSTKNDFYKKIKELGLAPKTFIASKENYKDLSYPNEVFIKPDNDVFYKSLDFEGQQKGYHSKSIDETIKILERIFNAGYDYNILVQEFVVGGDGSEYTIEGYRSENTISMAMSKNILLDKRVEWIGNFVAKVDSDEKILFDYARDIVKILGVYGLFNIDFKKDIRTGKFYSFEINLRQGRSHYFATLNGVNTSKLAIEDKIFGREEEIIGDKSFRYYNLDLAQTIDNLEDGLRDEFEKNKRKNNSTNPLVYEKDWNLRRKIKINKYLNKLSKETFAIKEI